ncbi:MAG: glyceraldehyde-3-phosphate dehydrogenase [Bacteroidota bacterium]
MNNKELLIRNENELTLNRWREKEKTALELLQIVGELRFDRSVELIIFRRKIYDARPSKLLNDHLFAKNYVNKPISIDTSLKLAKAIAQLPNLVPARIDIGRLAAEWLEEENNYAHINDFVSDRLEHFSDAAHDGLKVRDVVLYGFGRIGRLAARRLIEQTGRGEQLRLRAIVVRPKMKEVLQESLKRAALLQTDSIHGDFGGQIEVAEDGLEWQINGNRIHLIFAQRPDDIDYGDYGISDALLIDNTGVWRNKAVLSVHLRPGISQVMLTAPAPDIPNIVYGVNHKGLDIEQDRIFCAASCTTNAIVPVIKVVDDHWHIQRGHIETIHAYTSDQNLLDNFHKKPRRGRGAATNMVLTTTGAAKAVSKVMPHLKDCLTGNAVRVPTPNVSLAILNLELEKATDREQLKQVLKSASLSGALVEQLHYSTSTEYVSSHAVGMTSTSVLDAPSTIVSQNGKHVTLYAWYDNEFGYTCQLIRLAKHAAKVRRKTYY